MIFKHSYTFHIPRNQNYSMFHILFFMIYRTYSCYN